MAICSRDFIEKGFNFFHNGKFYRYSSSIDNSDLPGLNGKELKFPAPNKSTVRANTLINCAIMRRDSDNRILVSTLTQCDFKIKVPAFMITTFLPKATKNWYESINKFYSKNHKNL